MKGIDAPVRTLLTRNAFSRISFPFLHHGNITSLKSAAPPWGTVIAKCRSSPSTMLIGTVKPFPIILQPVFHMLGPPSRLSGRKWKKESEDARDAQEAAQQSAFSESQMHNQARIVRAPEAT